MNRPPYTDAQNNANWATAVAARPEVVLSQFCSQSFTGDGKSKIFTICYPPATDSLNIFVNGLLQHPNDDYVVTDKTIIFALVPDNGSTIIAQYRR